MLYFQTDLPLGLLSNLAADGDGCSPGPGPSPCGTASPVSTQPFGAGTTLIPPSLVTGASDSATVTTPIPISLPAFVAGLSILGLVIIILIVVLIIRRRPTENLPRVHADTPPTPRVMTSREIGRAHV